MVLMLAVGNVTNCLKFEHFQHGFKTVEPVNKISPVVRIVLAFFNEFPEPETIIRKFIISLLL